MKNIFIYSICTNGSYAMMDKSKMFEMDNEFKNMNDKKGCTEQKEEIEKSTEQETPKNKILQKEMEEKNYKEDISTLINNIRFNSIHRFIETHDMIENYQEDISTLITQNIRFNNT